VDRSFSNGSAEFQFDRLLKAARDGSREALGALLQGWQPMLLKIANEDLNRNLQVKTSPSDVVQETFVQANAAFADFRGNCEAELLGWLKRILSNKIAEQDRHFDTDKRQLAREARPTGDSKLQLLDFLAESGNSPRADVIARELRHDLLLALEKLAEDQRKVVQLRVYEQLSYPEIAVLMGRSEDACRKLFERALANLRNWMVSNDDT
jgi:RNA polymerase sigma-70 factor (ECF subfamily)